MCYNKGMNKQMSMSFLHDEVNLYGDRGYIGAEKRQDAIIRNKQGKKNQIQAESQANAD